MQTSRGLTIIELIISLSLLSIGFAVLFSLSRTFFQSWEEAYNATYAQQRLQQTSAQLYDDIKYARTIIPEPEQNVLLQLRKVIPTAQGEAEVTLNYYLYRADEKTPLALLRLSGPYNSQKNWNGGHVLLQDIDKAKTRLTFHKDTQLVEMSLAVTNYEAQTILARPINNRQRKTNGPATSATIPPQQ